ncbi:hypothetical protein FHR84_003723 [Actinopolyspora biskrensis]|uniref:Uncharacterized protein n=1 Tax=Actinopolyspora biskrensis TaxID=1470178 RepID=A0A852Z9Z8_9ACTN|nr:hypothetical protein [Actinopolyspora biskrensis]NYH80366.1 hypothetical protein [Actinopolyspora biskrensis]
MGSQHFSVDSDELERAETGVRDAVDELDKIAPFDVGANDGRGLRGYVDNNASAAGDDELEGALLVFGRSWEWGAKYLVEDGLETADALAETNENYRAADEQAGGFLDRVGHVMTGDPTKTYEQAQQDGSTPDISERAATAAETGDAGWFQQMGEKVF